MTSDNKIHVCTFRGNNGIFGKVHFLSSANGSSIGNRKQKGTKLGEKFRACACLGKNHGGAALSGHLFHPQDAEAL